MPTLSRRLLLSAAATFSLARPSLADGTSNAPATSQTAALSVGVALPLTGFEALQGDEALRGIQLAEDAVNQSGGIAGAPVTLMVGNMPSQAEAATVVNQLITQNAGVLLGSGNSGLAYPATAAAELAQTPYIELTAAANGITDRHFKFLLRVCPDTSMIGQLAADTIKARFNKQKLGFLFNTGATAGAIAAATLSALASDSVPVTFTSAYPNHQADLYAQVGQMMRAGIDVLLHAAGPDDTLALFAAMQAQGWRPKTLIGCGTGYGLRDTYCALGRALDGTLVIEAPLYPGDAAAVAQAYEAKYGVPPRSAASCTAYVGAKLVFDTLNANNADPTQLLGALRALNLKLGSLVNGFGVKFDAAGQNTASFVTLQHWQNGQLLPLTA